MGKSALENAQIKHEFRHGYLKSEQLIVVGGRLYCQELWAILGSPSYKDYPVLQYNPANLIRFDSWVIQFDDVPSEEFLEQHFELVIGQAIVPIVRSIQTPIEAVKFCMHHPYVMLLSRGKTDKYLSAWCKHYGLEWNPPSD